MNKRLIVIAVVYVLIIALTVVYIFGYMKKGREHEASRAGDYTVMVNEIEYNISNGDTEHALEACETLKTEYSSEKPEKNDTMIVFILPLVISILGILTMLIYLDRSILKPFRTMKDYAHEVAKGNLDKPLRMERGNYFGDFTWAFESMRKELAKSRAAEKEAIENNKTVIATLSHDIKTPVASIRAYSEALEANMDSTPEKRQKYLTTIMDKCDEVTKLTNDLFIHSISEMNRLEIKEEEMDLIRFLKNEVMTLFVDDSCSIMVALADSKPVDIASVDESVMISADPKRLLQIIENLKNNADKYAKTKTEILLEKGEEVKLHFRDFGPGIDEDEIPFITGKFYRGRNAGNEKGSGLGLYIVSELVSKMGGSLMLINRAPGLDVVMKYKQGMSNNGD